MSLELDAAREDGCVMEQGWWRGALGQGETLGQTVGGEEGCRADQGRV